MGKTATRLHSRLKKTPQNLPTRQRRSQGDFLNVADLIHQGLDPVHAAYVFIQRVSSAFAESVSHLPEMKAYARIVGTAEEEYIP